MNFIWRHPFAQRQQSNALKLQNQLVEINEQRTSTSHALCFKLKCQCLFCLMSECEYVFVLECERAFTERVPISQFSTLACDI